MERVSRRPTKTLARIFLFIVVAASVQVASGQQVSSQPVILISIDGMRPDYLDRVPARTFDGWQGMEYKQP